MGNKEGKIRYLKDVKVNPKENNDGALTLTAEDLEILNANLHSLEQKIEELPVSICNSIREFLNGKYANQNYSIDSSEVKNIEYSLQDIINWTNQNSIGELRKEVRILKDSYNRLPNDLYNFIDRKFEYLREELNRPKSYIACFRPPLKDLRLKSQLKYFLFTLPLWWLKRGKVKAFLKQIGVILLSIFAVILLFLVIYLANDNRHQRQEKQLLQQIEIYKTTASESFQSS